MTLIQRLILALLVATIALGLGSAALAARPPSVRAMLEAQWGAERTVSITATGVTISLGDGGSSPLVTVV